MEPDWPKGTPDHTKPRVLVLNATFTWWLSPCKILKISNGSSHFCCWSNNSSIWLDERRSKPHKCYFHYLHLKIHTKITWFFPQILMIKESCNLIDWKIQPSHPSKRDTFPWWSSSCKKSNRLVDSLQRYWWSKNPAIWLKMTNSMQKIRISTDSFQRYWWSKNPTILLDKRHNWPHAPKRSRPGCYLPLLTISLQKSLDCWISSRHIDDQKFLKSSNWTRDKTGHTQPKLPFFDDHLHVKNQRYWLVPSTDTAIWLFDSIFGHHWRTRFFPDIGFCRIIKNTVMLHTQGKKIHINGLSDSNRIRTQNHLLRKWTPRHLASFLAGRKKKSRYSEAHSEPSQISRTEIWNTLLHPKHIMTNTSTFTWSFQIPV